MVVNLKSVKNGIAAATIGVSTLGAGCAKKAPAIEKAAVQTSQTVKMKAGNLAKDTLDFDRVCAEYYKNNAESKILLDSIINTMKSLRAK